MTGGRPGWLSATQRALLAAAMVAASLLWVTSTAHADPPRNLQASDEVRDQLLDAGAAFKGLPVSDFTGLAPGRTFYAYDPDTGIYWAGAHLVPKADAYQAQVADQDAGSYLLFHQAPTGGWTAVDDGVTRGPGCPAPLPASILALWQWDAQQCRPVPDF